MGSDVPQGILGPRDRRLLAAVCAAQCLLIVLPALRGTQNVTGTTYLQVSHGDTKPGAVGPR